MSVRFIVGDVFDVLSGMPDRSADAVITSPPFYQLRSYLPEGHEAKHREIGAEPTPADYNDTLLRLTEEFARVLTPTGSIAVELGDTYAGAPSRAATVTSGENAYGGGGNRVGKDRADGGFTGRRGHGAGPRGGAHRALTAGGGHHMGGTGWPLPKSMCGIPHAYHLSLAYGRNVLRAPLSARQLAAAAREWVESAEAEGAVPVGGEVVSFMDAYLASVEDGPTVEFEPWRVRNVLCWTRPNPPVGALSDKMRPATSYVTVATRATNRWFDLDAVRTPLEEGATAAVGGQPRRATFRALGKGGADIGGKAIVGNMNGAPPLDWFDDREAEWQPLINLPTQPYKGAHYATFPSRLPVVLMESLCPREVCRTCGEPRRRVNTPLTLDSYRSSSRPQTVKAVELADEAGLTDEHIAAIRAFGTSDAGKATTLNDGNGKNTDRVKALAAEAKEVLGGYFREFVMSTNAERQSTWSDCGHDDYRRGIVLDPFGGSGTTGVAAVRTGRDAVLVDLDERNVDLARERVGLFLEVEHPEPPATVDVAVAL